MKRKMISVLALTLPVLMSVVLVSCEDFKPVADDATVKEVVGDIKAQHTYFRTHINYLANNPSEASSLQTTLTTNLKEKYEAEWGSATTVEVTVTSNSISAKVTAPDGKNKLDLSYSQIAYDSSAPKVTGAFSVSITKPNAGSTSSYTTDTDGNFTIALKDSITFSSVTYKGTDYDTDAFNKEMEREL